jgi:transglutaminase-like putative cysteine protease
MSRRGAIGAVVLVLWVFGLSLLFRREFFRKPGEQLAEAAMRVSPEAMFYVVERDGEQIGFASSTIDTTTTTIEVTDYMVVDLPVDGKLHRGSARTAVSLTRGLKPLGFRATLEMAEAPYAATGRFIGDSLLSLVIQTSTEAEDSQTVRLNGPVVFPTLVPLVVGLSQQLSVGERVPVRVMQPGALQGRDVELTVAAESLFVVSDSAAFDEASKRWVSARTDTVRAWLLTMPGSQVSGWVDGRGRIVEATQTGTLTARRTAYELAFENLRLSARQRETSVTADRDILESTAIAASAPLDRGRVARLRVRLGSVDLAGYDLEGERQRLVGDTLEIERERPEAMVATYTLPANRRGPFRETLAAEPLLQSTSPEIVALARRIVGQERDPRLVAEKLNTWVHDSLRKRITVGIPNALQVLRTRSGDCNEHTQLYLALARAVGLPARSAAGLALVRGKFYYHAWPEVYLGSWVAVDPTFGQFPADAAHLRFIVGGLTRQADLLRLIGRLEIEVLSTN